MRPPPPPPPKPAASNKLMTIPEDWDKSGAIESMSSSTCPTGGGGAIAPTSSLPATSASASNLASRKYDSDESDDSGSESDDSTSNNTSDSEECSGSSSSTCSSTDSECSCSGSSCDQSRPSPSIRLGPSKKGGSGGTKEKAAAASAPSYAVAATKSKVLPNATTTVASTSPLPMTRPVPVESIKTELRSAITSGSEGDNSGTLGNVLQDNPARSSAGSVLEMAAVAAITPKRKSLASTVRRTNSTGSHQMVPKEVPILPPPPIALLQTIPATSIVFKSEPIYISQAERGIGSDAINSFMQGAIIQSANCSGAGGRIAPKLPIPNDGATIFSKPMLPPMQPPVSAKAASGVKRTEFRLRPESDILKKSIVRATAVSSPRRTGLASITGPRAKSSGSKKRKSSVSDKVRHRCDMFHSRFIDLIPYLLGDMLNLSQKFLDLIIPDLTHRRLMYYFCFVRTELV